MKIYITRIEQETRQAEDTKADVGLHLLFSLSLLYLCFVSHRCWSVGYSLPATEVYIMIIRTAYAHI